MTTNIDTTQFNETDVIKSLRSKQDCESAESLRSKQDCESAESSEKAKSNRGRKKKYATDEQRILARRAQQKAYRERKKLELAELRALKASLQAQSTNE